MTTFKDFWHYRDLVLLFVKRDFVAQYKQTILGPAWHFLQPLCVAIVFTLVFGRIARISTDGTPPFLFYMSGTIIWTYFSTVLISTSSTFVDNADLFGKVYFPRLIIPVSKLLSNIIAFSIQFLFFLCYLVYFIQGGSRIAVNIWILATPLFLIVTACLALGLGAIITSLTTRYRDLVVVIGFGTQLLMFATPIIYPVSTIPAEYRVWIMLNPLTPIVEQFRHAYLGTPAVSGLMLTCSVFTTFLILATGVVLFTRAERDFIDSI